MNHVIEREGVRVLVGFDTAWYRSETWDYLTSLCSEKPLDFVLMDCTMGKLSGGDTHMGIDDNERVRDEMSARGILGEATQYVVLTYRTVATIVQRTRQTGYHAGMVAHTTGMLLEHNSATPHDGTVYRE